MEALIRERQIYRAGLPRADVVQSALRRGLRDHLKHVGGEIAGNDFGGMRRHMKADMAGAAAKVEDMRTGPAGDQAGERLQVRALRVDGAAEIGGGSHAELAVDQRLVGFCFGSSRLPLDRAGVRRGQKG